MGYQRIDTPASVLSSAFEANSGNARQSGESTIPRLGAPHTTLATATQNLRLTYFTAKKTETITQVRVITGGTAAGATPTLCRIGIYSVASNGDLTLVASTANDTTLFAGTITAYTRTLQASWSKVAGTRYALGVLVVTGATAPSFTGYVQSALSADMAEAPRITGLVTSQADLPATVEAASVTASSIAIYGVMLP